MSAASRSAAGVVRIEIAPRGIAIEAPAGTRLLDALLAAQVPISYSCQAGRCGTCRCELLAGDVDEEADIQFRGLQIPGEGHHILACRARLTSDCTLLLPEADDVVVHPPQILKCHVHAIELPNESTAVLRLRTNRPLRFSAGQFARLDFGAGRVRPYSMANEEGAELLEFHIRHVAGGVVSEWVRNGLRCGDVIKLIGPLGTSYLRHRHEGPSLCIAGGTGLAPVHSIVRTALACGAASSFHVYAGARTEAELYYVDRLRQLERQFPGRVAVTVATDLAASDPSIRCGRIVDVAAADLSSLSQWKVYLAGPPPMVDAGVQLALRLSARPVDIHADAFYPAEA